MLGFERKRINPHEKYDHPKLRHTFAMRQLRRGTPAEQVAQWMGLSDVAALARHRRVLVAPADVA